MLRRINVVMVATVLVVACASIIPLSSGARFSATTQASVSITILIPESTPTSDVPEIEVVDPESDPNPTSDPEPEPPADDETTPETDVVTPTPEVEVTPESPKVDVVVPEPTPQDAPAAPEL